MSTELSVRDKKLRQRLRDIRKKEVELEEARKHKNTEVAYLINTVNKQKPN